MAGCGINVEDDDPEVKYCEGHQSQRQIESPPSEFPHARSTFKVIGKNSNTQCVFTLAAQNACTVQPPTCEIGQLQCIEGQFLENGIHAAALAGTIGTVPFYRPHHRVLCHTVHNSQARSSIASTAYCAFQLGATFAGRVVMK